MTRLLSPKQREHSKEYHAKYYLVNRSKILARVKANASTPRGSIIAAMASARYFSIRDGSAEPQHPTRPLSESCEACGGPPSKGQRLHMDHDHTTGRFRGWLCGSCNRALGFLGDDPQRLHMLIQYLDRE